MNREPSYAYNHPLFTEAMHIYSDSKVSDFLNSITDDQSAEFLNDRNLPVFNYAIPYDTTNREPLFYEKYLGSINDVSQLQFTLDKAIRVYSDESAERSICT